MEFQYKGSRVGEKIDFFPLTFVSTTTTTTTKMPKRASKISQSAKRENEKTIKKLYLDKDAYVFARIDSNLGAGGFRIVLNDGSTATGIPRGLFNRRSLRISIGDIVLVEGSDNKSTQHQIVGLLSHEDATQFYKNQMISELVWRKPEADDKEKDDTFEFVDDSDDSDDEVDVDNI